MNRILSAKFNFSLIFLSIFLCVLSRAAFGQITLAPRQLMVLKPGLDSVYGTWVAAVVNNGSAPARYRIPVLLPAQAKDFQPLEGIAKEDVKIDEHGVWIEKDFGTGTNVVSVAFVSNADFGEATLKFKAMADVGEVTIMTPKGMLEVQSALFKDGGTEDQDNQKYAILTSSRTIIANDEITMTIHGVPEGRKRLLILGLCFAGILLGGALILAYKSKPNLVAVGQV